MKDLIVQLQELPYFSLHALTQYFEDPHKSRVYAMRAVDSGVLIRLKQGIYVTREFVKKAELLGSLGDWKRYILTQIIYPNSALSLQTVLSESQIIPEQSYGYSLVSQRKNVHFVNELYDAQYRSLTPKFFRGYILVQKQYSYMIATPEKALFDLLRFASIAREESWFEALRLHLGKDVFDTDLFESYIHRAESPKMFRVLSFLQKLDDYGSSF